MPRPNPCSALTHRYVKRLRFGLFGAAVALCSLAVAAQQAASSLPHGSTAITAAASATPDPATSAPPTDPLWTSLRQPLELHFPDIHSAVLLLQGREVFSYYRDGQPEALRDVQSVAKSALSALVGRALALGHVRSLDQPVVELLPAWAALNPDPRAARITVRHLLTMTTGLAAADPAGTARALPAVQAWARPLQAEPGSQFVYDNSVMSLLPAVLEAATGQPLEDFARRQLVEPLGLATPTPALRGAVRLRTQDMARLGQLYLQNGQWQGQQLLLASFVKESGQAQNAGGPPVRLRYGYLWWVLTASQGAPADEAVPYFANGFGGQTIWVDAKNQLVLAITATATLASTQRGQVRQWIWEQMYPAVAQYRKQQPAPAAP